MTAAAAMGHLEQVLARPRGTSLARQRIWSDQRFERVGFRSSHSVERI